MNYREATARPRGHRRMLATVAGLALAGGLAAGCGDDDEATDSGEAASAPASLEITASESGKEVTLQTPESAEAGLTEITFANEGSKPHEAQLLRVEGDHDEAEVLEALDAASNGEPFPEWFFGGGGVGTTPPGESLTVTQELEGGNTYWVVDTEASGQPPIAPIEVTGESAGEALPETDSIVSAIDYGFETEGVTAGETVTFKNEGEQPHHMIAVPFTDEEATIEDVEAFFKEEGEGDGPPPVDFRNGVSTSVLEGGTEQVSSASFDSGRYALVCFIADRQGGPPHIAQGMIDELEVE